MSTIPWKLAGKSLAGIKLGGLSRRPISKAAREAEGGQETGAGRVHVVTVDSSEVLYLPSGGDAVDLKKRCEARDAQSSGSPSSLVFDATEALFVADFAKRAIISQRPTLAVRVIVCATVCTCVFASVCVCFLLCLFLCRCRCLILRLCLCVFMCMCVRTRVSVCKRTSIRKSNLKHEFSLSRLPHTGRGGRAVRGV